ncbi:UDP-N-acetylglucosamine 2-epimerase (non-hydrolyzing) [Pseudanabaena sp. FACHB-1998]|uniref:non-hydrolyzing UDP-N-acetylglucosamine 2-epimerase n=1 Tax=Pseudanabaena sp. FACHB-1998 TaxID=2692858 RepID=UPI0016815261|nr:UDP-N-acetylglucosamine 2-epimerase (non-hydrolyzing) [Pseudanabaena sp. FACHB-1998]MBD2178839.1 UDP-N-acetylglucosamine 2-epimerase (non-hydrolyzing) [Pseudanabaena sp. FACHB-1998]
MKIITILGTRPEIIRLSRIINKLDQFCDHVLVHTGQNFDKNLSDVFFEQLQIRKPNYFLGIRGDTFGEQIGKIIIECEKVFNKEQPDKILILGDTNSSLAAIVAKRMGIPVYHMEAGNRCYDNRVPEEVNRKIIDHSSDILMPYTERSRANLLREGIPSDRIYVTGNPIFEVIEHYASQIAESQILSHLALKPQKYFLVTMHRQENVDIKERLIALTQSLESLQKQYQIPIVCSWHPRTKYWMQQHSISIHNSEIYFCEPFNFFDFISLERHALCVLSDSGTVQEECCIFQIPNVTIRDVTERPETIECGSNILSGAEPETIERSVKIVLSEPSNWAIPPEYLVESVSNKVIKILLGYSL